MGRRRPAKSKQSSPPVTVQIESLSHDGRGIAHVNDKVVFIDGALTGETVRIGYIAGHRNYDEARCLEVLEASTERVTPRCQYHLLCGGCSLQHMQPDRQILNKQATLLDLLRRTASIEPVQLLPPLRSEFWGYRSKARLGVRYVNKKQRVLVGFREKHSAFLADMDRCEVLDPRVGHNLHVIAQCIQSLHAFNRIAQIEVAASETVVALVFRHLVDLDQHDLEKLIELAQTFNYHIYLQAGGPETIKLLYPHSSALSYSLPDFDIEIHFRPTDFTQINETINRAMVSQAIELLELNDQDIVLDLFCGLGNFSLPIATRAAQVVGVEGDAGLIERAHENARQNGIDNVEFFVQDLTQSLDELPWAQRPFSKVLIDPARPGAFEVMPTIADMQPERIVYVSCNPSTLARDAGELVNRHNYRLQSAGVMDMFPHTAHVESMALFIRR